MATFEVGKSYEFSDPMWDPITVVRRTDKTIFVEAGRAKWSMRVKRDDRGDEYVTDSSAPRRVRNDRTCNARWSTE